MLPDAFPNILGGLADAIAGAILGALIAFFTLRAQRVKKVIEYDVNSMPLVMFKPKAERSLVVTVEKSLLTGDANDSGKQQQVDNAYGFEIGLTNRGNTEATQVSVGITLEKSAAIIEHETQP